MKSVKTIQFKLEFDKFRYLVLDVPRMPNYFTATRSNSVLDQLAHRRAQGINNSSEVPDLAVEQAYNCF